MRPSTASLSLALTLILSTIACSLGVPATPSNPMDAAATIVAMTLQAAGVSTSPASPSTASPSSVPPTTTATAKPTLKIGAGGAQCHSGPGTENDVIATFGAGASVDMIAKDTADGYWLVKDPASGSSCWVLMQDATPGGSYSLLPEITPPAVAAKESPATPSWAAISNAWRYECTPGTVTVTLQWTDRADNESGYRVYRNGELIAELPAGSTSYTDIVSSFGGTFSYSVRAYNDVGESGPLGTGNFSC